MLPFFSRPYPPVVVDCPAGSMVMSNDPSDEKILPPAPALCLGTRQSTMCPWCWEHLCSEAAHSPSQTVYPIPSCSNGVGYPSLILFSAFFFFFSSIQKNTTGTKCITVSLSDGALTVYRANTKDCTTGLTTFHSPEATTFRSKFAWHSCPVWLAFLLITLAVHLQHFLAIHCGFGRECRRSIHQGVNIP